MSNFSPTKLTNRRLALEFNPPWNLIANRGQIRPKQNLAGSEVALTFDAYTIMRNLLKEVRTFYQQNQG